MQGIQKSGIFAKAEKRWLFGRKSRGMVGGAVCSSVDNNI
jgi:hypothetical protein